MDKLSFNKLCKEIDKLLEANGKVTIAIDGDCCSGKTTLAFMLSKKYCCDVIHIDNFFLPFSFRSQERYNEPGGNVHYERIIEEVVPFLRDTKEFSYGKFDCSKGEITEKITISEGAVRIIEGSYSMHPKLIAFYDYKIFLSVSSVIQKERIIKREGEEALKVFNEKWIPLEKLYQNFYKIKEKADYKYDVF